MSKLWLDLRGVKPRSKLLLKMIRDACEEHEVPRRLVKVQSWKDGGTRVKPGAEATLVGRFKTEPSEPYSGVWKLPEPKVGRPRKKENEKRVHTGFSLYGKHINLIDSGMEKRDIGNRSEAVRTAIEFWAKKGYPA